MRHRADFAGIWEKIFELLRQIAGPAISFVLLITALKAMGELGGAVDRGQFWGGSFQFDPGTTTAWGAAAAFGALVANVVGSYFLLARMLDVNGRLAPGDTQVWAYIGLSILIGIGTIIGFIALIVPGIVLMVRWSAAPGFLIGLRTQVTEAMSKSWHATKDDAWWIFFAGLVGYIVILAIGVAIGGLLGWFGADDVVTAIATGLVESVSTIVSLAFGIAVFLLVHTDAGEIEQVFA